MWLARWVCIFGCCTDRYTPPGYRQLESESTYVTYQSRNHVTNHSNNHVTNHSSKATKIKPDLIHIQNHNIYDPDEIQRVRNELFAKTKFKTIENMVSDPIPIPHIKQPIFNPVDSMVVTLLRNATIVCDNMSHTIARGQTLYLIERGIVESLVMVPGKIDQRMIGFIPSSTFEEPTSRALIIPPKSITYHNTI